MIGYIPMTGDLPHIGHVRALTQASRLCYHLILGLLSDEAIKKYKGELPIIPYNQRYEMFQAIGIADEIVKQDDIFPSGRVLERVDVMFSGDGFEREERKAMNEYGVIATDIDYCDEQSTTNIKKNVYEQEREKQFKKTPAPVSGCERQKVS